MKISLEVGPVVGVAIVYDYDTIVKTIAIILPFIIIAIYWRPNA